MRSLREYLNWGLAVLTTLSLDHYSEAEVRDFPVTTEESRLLSYLFYGLRTEETKNVFNGSRQFSSGDARVYLFIRRLKPTVKLRNHGTATLNHV